MRKFFITTVMAFVFAGAGLILGNPTVSEAKSVPNGSYKKTCTNIKVDSNGIYATCQKADGSWQETSLSSYGFPCDDIENDNGELVCVGPSK